MSTAELRKAMKAIDKEIRVSSLCRARSWTVRTNYNLDKVRVLLKSLGLHEHSNDIEGSRYDWTHVLYIHKKEK